VELSPLAEDELRMLLGLAIDAAIAQFDRQSGDPDLESDHHAYDSDGRGLDLTDCESEGVMGQISAASLSSGRNWLKRMSRRAAASGSERLKALGNMLQYRRIALLNKEPANSLE
jgi:hypothetical protein